MPPTLIATGATLVLLSLLVAIAIVDSRRMVIPDALNLMLAAAGGGFWLLTGPEALPGQILGAAAALTVFWLVRRVHAGATGRIGLGLGDVKMAGAAALWVAPSLLPTLLLCACAAALAYAMGRMATMGSAVVQARMPFGPFLAFGLAATWFLQQWMEMPA